MGSGSGSEKYHLNQKPSLQVPPVPPESKAEVNLSPMNFCKDGTFQIPPRALLLFSIVLGGVGGVACESTAHSQRMVLFRSRAGRRNLQNERKQAAYSNNNQAQSTLGHHATNTKKLFFLSAYVLVSASQEPVTRTSQAEQPRRPGHPPDWILTVCRHRGRHRVFAQQPCATIELAVISMAGV